MLGLFNVNKAPERKPSDFPLKYTREPRYGMKLGIFRIDHAYLLNFLNAVNTLVNNVYFSIIIKFIINIVFGTIVLKELSE